MKNSKIIRSSKLFRLGKICVLIYLILGICLRLGQTRLLFFPSSEIASTPVSINLSYEEVKMTTAQNQLTGWWIPAKLPNSHTILYLHGNGSNLGDLLDEAFNFHNLGVNTLLIDYRGYGQSEGDFPNETRVYEDVQAAWDYLVTERNIEPETIFLYGHSLGGAIAVELASRQSNLAGVIIESSFTSIEGMLDHLFTVPLFPKKLILTQKFDSIGKISQIKAPILIIHGTDDSVIPFTMSQQLFEKAKGTKFLVLFDGAGHNNIAKYDPVKYNQTLIYFMNQTYE